MAKVFISYSHQDEDLRNEVEAALSPLRRQGLIEVWHDRRIAPGTDFAAEIDENLEQADIVLFLVSSYFINSDYAYGIEVQRALERQARNEATVIPIILRPTDWHHLPFGRLQALPPDGKPITSYPDIHEALAEISKGLRRLLAGPPTEGSNVGESHSSEATNSKAAASQQQARHDNTGPRSSNLRVKRTFSDQDRDRYLDEAFQYVATFFDNSLVELAERNQGIDTHFRQKGTDRFTVTIYRGGGIISQCTIWQGSRSSFANGIAYTEGDTDESDSYNEILTLDDDGHVLFLRPTTGQYFQQDVEEALTPQGAS